MKKFYAWLLLTISTFQWIGGPVCFEVTYFIEIGHQMDEAETAISETLKVESGMESTVTILEESQLIPRGNIYSDFFAFSFDGCDETTYFSISEGYQTTIYEKVVSHQIPQSKSEDKATQLKNLHQDFTIPEVELLLPISDFLRMLNFELAEFHYQLFPSLHTPPPDLA